MPSQKIIPQRLEAVLNPHYKRDGLKSYVWLLQKYNITPTLKGPYFRTEDSSTTPPSIKTIHGGLQNLHKQVHERHHHAGAADSSVDAHSRVQAAATSQAGAKATAYDQQNDSEYTVPVSIGGQIFQLDFDTGSSDLWVFSTNLDAATQKKLKAAGHSIYDPSKSRPVAAKQAAGSTWAIGYGDGSSASGVVYNDDLKVGSIVVEGQAIEAAAQVDDAFLNTASDGLLGLAMGKINTVKPKRVQTPVENMISQRDISSQNELFTAYLSSYKDTDEADQGKSFYTFGYVDQDVLKRCNATDFWYTPLVAQQQRGFWEFKSATYTLNGTTYARAALDDATPSFNSAIADTGTTLALVADDVVAAIYAAIPGATYDAVNQGYVLPTKTAEKDLPSVGFDVGGKTFFVPKEALLFAETKRGWCYGGIQSRGSLTFDILGDTWLKGVYACFDQGRKRFGAVQRTLQSQNLSTPA